MHIHKTLRRIILLPIFVTTIAFAQEPSFSRFTEELPQLLEADINAVWIRGLTNDFAVKICGRLKNDTSQFVKTQVAEWGVRNKPYLKGAASAMNEFGNRYLRIR